MGKREKKLKSTNIRNQLEEETTPSQTVVQNNNHNDGNDDDDDAEANEDLSLKIVEKAMLRKCTNANSDTFAGDTSALLVDDEMVKEQEKGGSDKAVVVVDEAIKTNHVEVSDNVVLRKLLVS
ncbi:hypothetical protein ACH5RR_021315 [Cinchona calisaya]|uniref:Uncharacterized protein n=1 Tax=Cinchona calisaya TaxID=153742 RepID=A0ABD2ZIQ9_9GENT